MHLNTKSCNCGYEFTKQNIKPPLLRPAQGIGNKQKNFYGGNVDRFCAADCPDCEKLYLLWIKQTGQTWKVVTISANGWDPNAQGDGVTDDTAAIQSIIDSRSVPNADGDAFDDLDKDALKTWLDKRSIKYHPQTGDRKLRDACRAALIALDDKENEDEIS